MPAPFVDGKYQFHIVCTISSRGVYSSVNQFENRGPVPANPAIVPRHLLSSVSLSIGALLSVSLPAVLQAVHLSAGSLLLSVSLPAILQTVHLSLATSLLPHLLSLSQVAVTSTVALQSHLPLPPPNNLQLPILLRLLLWVYLTSSKGFLLSASPVLNHWRPILLLNLASSQTLHLCFMRLQALGQLTGPQYLFSQYDRSEKMERTDRQGI